MPKINIISLSEDMEKKILNICSNQHGAKMMKHLLREEKFNISQEDAEWLFEQVQETVREKYADALILRGFYTVQTDEGRLCLNKYSRKKISIHIHTGNLDGLTVTRTDVTIWNNEYAAGREIDVIIPSEISKLAPYCFNGCRDIRRVVIPDGVNIIPGCAFCGCAGLEEVIIPEHVTAIDAGAFFCCEKLHSIRLPSSLSAIGPEAFCGCKNLRKIRLPETLEKIGYGAFAFCSGIDHMEIPDNIVISPEKNAFYGSSVTLASSRAQQSREEPVETVMKDLGEALDLFVNTAIHVSCICYAINIQEIEYPAEEHIGDLVNEADWEADLGEYLNGTNWVILDQQYKWEGRMSRTHTEYLSQMIIGTMKKYGGEMFRASEDGLDYYEEEHQCIDLISLRFLHVRGRWFTMLFEWYD